MSNDVETERVAEAVGLLASEYSEAAIVLKYRSNWELLVAVILSAQCTDKMVNRVTARLFAKYPDIDDYVAADESEFQEDIRPAGFFRNKTKSILGAARMIVADFEGEVPGTMDELLCLPGVARKTANIVLGNAFGIVEGIAVDTHVKRLSQRLGLTSETNPDKIERDLMRIVPRDQWFKLTYWLIDHGRAICKARKPLCDRCVLARICPSAFEI